MNKHAKWAGLLMPLLLVVVMGCGDVPPPPQTSQPGPPPSPPQRRQARIDPTNANPYAAPANSAAPHAEPGQGAGPSTPGNGHLIEAKTGVGAKGRNYGGGIITEPIRQKFRAEQWVALEVQVPKALQLFEATEGRLPSTHEEFIKKIIVANQIALPKLPPGQEFVYVPEKGKLMVFVPDEKAGEK